jgi:GrpB-like predicted nucleotidyltransferase (UPF0157 family)
MSARIELVPYDVRWPQMFEAERAVLEHVLADWLCGPIEHIGSTAVHGLRAKPVIDIMAPVHGLASSRDATRALATAGYCHFPYKPDVMHWYCKPSAKTRTHHLHLVPFESALWRDRLTFRDTLRRRPDLAEEYEQLKVQLAARFGADREAYTDAKTAFVARVLSTPLGPPPSER